MNPATTNMKPNDTPQQQRAETSENQRLMLCSLIYLSILYLNIFVFKE
jgi:hypothetical protein